MMYRLKANCMLIMGFAFINVSIECVTCDQTCEYHLKLMDHAFAIIPYLPSSFWKTLAWYY